MIVTEEEAKTKRCQESFAAAFQWDASKLPTTAPMHCIGSACMAWRWARQNVYAPIEGADFEDHTIAHFTLHEAAGEYSTTHGYCGKAGKP